MRNERLQIEGLTTKEDEERVRHALGEVWGIRQIKVDPRTSEVMFSWDETAGAPWDFRQALAASGFVIRAEMPTP